MARVIIDFLTDWTEEDCAIWLREAEARAEQPMTGVACAKCYRPLPIVGAEMQATWADQPTVFFCVCADGESVLVHSRDNYSMHPGPRGD